MVLGPIFVGMTAKKFTPKAVDAVLPFAPIAGVLSTVCLVGSAVAQVAAEPAGALPSLTPARCNHPWRCFPSLPTPLPLPPLTPPRVCWHR